MLGIWTLRGNCSTARSGWVAADAASVDSCWPNGCKFDEHAYKIAHSSGSLTPDRNVPSRSGQDPKQWVLASDPAANDTSGRYIMAARILPRAADIARRLGLRFHRAS